MQVFNLFVYVLDVQLQQTVPWVVAVYWADCWHYNLDVFQIGYCHTSRGHYFNVVDVGTQECNDLRLIGDRQL